MLGFVFGRANSGKTEYIFESIAQDVIKGTGPVILIVPEQSTFDAERKLVARLGAAGSASVEVTSFSRLADMIFEELGGEYGTPLDESGRIILMSRALDCVRPSLQLYGRHAASAEFVQAILLTLDEMKQAGLCAEDMLALSRRAQSDSLRAMMQDLALIAGEYDGLLGTSHTDGVDRLTMLYDMLADSDFFAGKKVYFDAFDGFTGQQYKIIDRILSRSDDVVFSFPADGAEDRENGLGTFSNVKSAARRITQMANAHGVKSAAPVILDKSHFSSPAITALELSFAGLSDAVYEEETDDITVISAGNLYDEVRYVARTIRRMVRENPANRYRDFVLIARDISSYANALESIFAKYDIPLFLDHNRPAASLPLMTFVHASVAAACSFSSEEIFRMLKSGLTALSDEEISELENYAFIWNLGGEQWREPFTLDPEGYNDGHRDTEKSSQTLEYLNTLREQVVAPLEPLRVAAQSRRPKKLVRAIYAYIKQTDADARLKTITDAFAAKGDGETADLYRQSYDALMRLLGQLDASFGEEEQPASKTLELLETLFGAMDLGRIPQKLDTVAAGSAEKFRPGRPRYTFVLGMNQGAFPAVRSGGLIHPVNRRQLIEMGVELDDCRLKSSVDESYLLYKILFSCYSKLFISYPRADASGRAMEPSSAVAKILSFIPNCRRPFVGGEASLDVTQIETAGDVLELAAPHWRDGSAAVAAVKESLRGTSYEAKMRALDHIDAPPDAAIDKAVAQRLYGKRMTLSASKVDTFNRCHFSYFCNYGMKLKPLRRAEMDAMQRGTAVHFVLDGLMRKYGANYKNTTPEARHADVARLLAEYKYELLSGEESKDPKLDYMMRRMDVLLCELSDRLQAEFAKSGFEPSYFELKIGMQESDPVPPLRIPLSDGEISIVGAVDRVDTMTYDDRLIFRVIDYKTGKRTFSLPDILYGLNMQMLIYMTAISRGGIKGVDRETEPAGILYLPARRSVAAGESGRVKADRDVRMNGLLVSDDHVLSAMEPDRPSSGEFIKIRFKKDGEPYAGSDVVSPDAMRLIEDHVIREVTKMGEKLLAGDIDANPVDGLDSAACKYCEFDSICHRKNGEIFAVPDRKIEEVIEIIKEDAGHGV